MVELKRIEEQGCTQKSERKHKAIRSRINIPYGQPLWFGDFAVAFSYRLCPEVPRWRGNYSEVRSRAQCLRSPWESLGSQWHCQFSEVASCRTSELCSLWTFPLGRAVPAGGFLEGSLLGPGERAAAGPDRGWTLRASQDMLELGVFSVV